jgi:hypothetical protein
MYAHVTRLLKSVSDPFPLHIRTNSDYRKKPYPHPHPCIIRSTPNPTKKSGSGYGKGIIRTDPIRFYLYEECKKICKIFWEPERKAGQMSYAPWPLFFQPSLSYLTMRMNCDLHLV